MLKSNIWKKLLKIYRKIASYDEVVAENESTFSSANAGGNPEEQYAHMLSHCRQLFIKFAKMVQFQIYRKRSMHFVHEFTAQHDGFSDFATNQIR